MNFHLFSFEGNFSLNVIWRKIVNHSKRSDILCDMLKGNNR